MSAESAPSAQAKKIGHGIPTNQMIPPAGRGVAVSSMIAPPLKAPPGLAGPARGVGMASHMPPPPGVPPPGMIANAPGIP